MTSQDLATLALLRWDQLRKDGIAPRDRLNDPEIIKIANELQPIRDAIQRTK